MTVPIPTLIQAHSDSASLEVTFSNGETFSLPCEYLRVFSPSADNRLNERQVVSGKKYVNIKAIEAVGNYAIKIFFDDGHHSGLYTWDILYYLGSQHETAWQQYLDWLDECRLSREPIKN